MRIVVALNYRQAMYHVPDFNQREDILILTTMNDADFKLMGVSERCEILKVGEYWKGHYIGYVERRLSIMEFRWK